MRWKDRGSKPVTLISNMHNAAYSCVVLRTNSKRERVHVVCPSGISDYNKYMGGVDKFDQYNMVTYTTSKKSRRWWTKLFYYFIDTAIVNFYILYKDSCNK